LPGSGPPPATCADLAPGPPPAGRALLTLGARGEEVAELQRLLADRGYPPDNSLRGDGSWDGVFGDGTEAAVAALQHDAGLAVDGKAGRQVYCALGVT
jgi:peptidoglycan hydrolase-like protein with peptidoglycan-binding domain